MESVITVEIFSRQTPDHIFDLILPIQQEEFGIPIARKDQPDLDAISDFYQTGNGNFWVAQDNDKIVGTVALKDIGNGHVALRKMFVHKDYRGKDKGVAAQLLGTAVSSARLLGVSDIYLGTTAQFLAAHRFYAKHGFAEIRKADLPESFPVMTVDTKFFRMPLKGATCPTQQTP